MPFVHPTRKRTRVGQEPEVESAPAFAQSHACDYARNAPFPFRRGWGKRRLGRRGGWGGSRPEVRVWRDGNLWLRNLQARCCSGCRRFRRRVLLFDKTRQNVIKEHMARDDDNHPNDRADLFPPTPLFPVSPLVVIASLLFYVWCHTPICTRNGAELSGPKDPFQAGMFPSPSWNASTLSLRRCLL